MESLDKTQLQKPSKRFLVRGSIATGIIVVVLIAQTSWFHNLFSKKPKSVAAIDTNTTVGGLVTKDSNNNSIPDWQERLWGLDPTVVTTNGVSNKTIIEEKRKSLQGPGDQKGPLNETDILAQQLYSVTSSLGQSGVINTESLASVGAELGKTLELKQVTNQFSIKDIRTTKTTPSSLNSYYNTVTKIVAPYDNDIVEIDLIVSALETGDFSNLSKLTQKSVSYKALSKNLKEISVPIGVASYHLAIINGLYGIAESLNYLSELEDNGINALAGIGIYKKYALSMDQALGEMHDYFVQYGIIKR